MGQRWCLSLPNGQEVRSGICRWTGKNQDKRPATKPHHEQDDRWEINLSDLEFIKTTGRDYLGTSWKAHVWLGRWRESVEVEIKTVELNKKGAKECLKEVELIRGLRHLNLLNMVGVCMEDRKVHVVTERPASVELLQYWLKRCGLSALPLHLHILSQVGSGMAYLEDHELLYLELAARNVLMTSDLVCKLQVCGLVRRSRDGSVADLPLSYHHMAPEVGSGSVSMKVSVWSFGVFMLEVLKGGQLHLHEYMNNQEVMQKVKKGHGFPAPNNCPQDLYKLMKKCWVLPPQKRPTFAALRDALMEAAAGYSEEDVQMCLESSSEF